MARISATTYHKSSYVYIAVLQILWACDMPIANSLQKVWADFQNDGPIRDSTLIWINELQRKHVNFKDFKSVTVEPALSSHQLKWNKWDIWQIDYNTDMIQHICHPTVAQVFNNSSIHLESSLKYLQIKKEMVAAW